MATESKAADVETDFAYLSVTANFDVTFKVPPAGKFPTNLSKTIQDAVQSQLAHKFEKSGRGDHSVVVTNLNVGDCDVDMESTVLLGGVLTDATIIDPSAAAGSGAPRQYLLNLEGPARSADAFPGGVFSTAEGVKKCTMLVTSDGGAKTQLLHPVDLLSNSDFLRDPEYHSNMLVTAAGCIPSKNPIQAKEVSGCSYSLNLGSHGSADNMHRWVFKRMDDGVAATPPGLSWYHFQLTCARLHQNKMISGDDVRGLLAGALQRPSEDDLPLTPLVSEEGDEMKDRDGNVMMSYMGPVEFGDAICIPAALYERLCKAAALSDMGARPYHIGGPITACVQSREVGGEGEHGEFRAAGGCVVSLKFNFVCYPQQVKFRG
jgi:hypothetical protein